MITQEEVRRMFDYDAESGELVNRVTRSSNTKVGDRAGCISNGYLAVRIRDKLYYVHRLIWLWVYGYFPEHCIDHINRDGLDNRLENLREVTQACNIRNAKQQYNNTSGVTGVYWYKQKGGWKSQIVVNNRTYGLGFHRDFTEAVLTRLAAEQCLNWEGCDSSSTAYQYYFREIKR